jgi:hypothetical protein
MTLHNKDRHESIERWNKAKNELSNAVTCLDFVHPDDAALHRLEELVRSVIKLSDDARPHAEAA